MPKKILIIDDDADLCMLLSRFLIKNGYEADTAHSGNKGIGKYKAERFDAVIADFRLGDMDGLQLIEKLKQLDSRVIILFITGYSDIRQATEVIKLGAYDYIPKPLIPEEVLNILRQMTATNFVRRRRLMETSDEAPHQELSARPGGDFFIGSAEATRSLYRQVEVVAPTNYSVLLYGESGTGKEVIARTIHNYSKRADQPFVALDCGTLSRELAGSELFGHVKGAFTGALQDKVGHFEMAAGGTLFLDEIANLSLDVQAVLLRTIQERVFKRVGSSKEMVADIRIIVASNENLKTAYQKGKFREDLYHRLNEFTIQLPPLRDRTEDIRPLAEFFLKKSCEENEKPVSGFSENVLRAFQQYPWYGNLREMRNVVRRAVLLTPANALIDESALLPELMEDMGTGYTIIHDTQPAASEHEGAKSTAVLKEASARAEYQAIMNVLQQVNFNKKKAAELLKIDRKTLYNKLKLFRETL